jgi:hypothetical protein
MKDVELEALDKPLRSRFCDELKARYAAQTQLTSERAMSLVRESMLAIGIIPPEEVQVTRL